MEQEQTLVRCSACGWTREPDDPLPKDCNGNSFLRHDWRPLASAKAEGDVAAAAVSATPAQLPPDGAQAALDQVHLEVRRVALKAGVQPEDLDAALRDFARELVPHAGRQPSIHRPAHWRGWFRGWAAGRASKP